MSIACIRIGLFGFSDRQKDSQLSIKSLPASVEVFCLCLIF